MKEFQSPIKLWTARYSDKIIGLFNAIREEPDEIGLDLGNVTFFHPFGLNILAGIIFQCIHDRKAVGWNDPSRRETREFLDSIGLIGCIDEYINLGKEMSTSFRGGGATLQLQRMLHKDTFMANRIVEVFRNRMEITEPAQDSLAMSLNELMNNAFDHSESPIGCLVCAQAYPAKQSIRAAMTDFGIGIKKSLDKNQKWKNDVRSDFDAIKLALKEGVSSIKGSRGLGLARLEDFLKINEGGMTIVSGNALFKKTYSKSTGTEKELTLKNYFQGTGIEIEVRTNKSGLYALREEEGRGDYYF